jgi:hypothetical protein
VRVKAVKIDDYKENKGLQLDVNTSPVWQFLVSEGGSSFLNWLKPTKEYVKPKVENKVGFFNLLSMLGQEVVEETGSTSSEDFQVNPSVCAIGVSLKEFQSDKNKWLSYGVPIFVSVDLASKDLIEVLSWLQESDLVDGVTYVLDLSLNYTSVHELTQILKEQKISEEQVRLVGNCVFKYKGQSYCGLFSPSFAKSYKLDWVYDSEPHKATQVFLSKDSSREVPIEDCTYPKVVRTGGI